MGEEPRPATRLEWILIWVTLVGLALMAVGWHLSVLRQSESPPGSVLDLFEEPPPPPRHPFRPKTPPWEQSEDGLKAAALEQIKSEQLLGRDELTSLWSWASCRTWDVLPMSMIRAGSHQSPSVYDLVVTDVQIEDYEGDTARVRVIFRHATDRKLPIANDVGGTERWDYVPGGWVNRTCQYSEGPSILEMFRNGTIRLADD